MRASFLFLTVLLSACGGADPTDLLGDASTTSDVTTPPPDAQNDSPPPPPPQVCAPDAGACTDPNVPANWVPIAYTTDANKPCPASYSSAAVEDVTVDPALGSNACSCSCTKTADPDCQTGVTTISGVGQTCSGFSGGFSYSNGTCRPTGGTIDDYDEATTIKPSGGTCTVTTVPNNAAITSTSGRLCTPDASCAPAACGGYAPSGFSACIATAGDVACPAGSAFSAKHVVTELASVQCSDCGSACTFQGSCTSPKLSFYAENTCTTLIVSIPANGTCTQTNKANTAVGGSKYTATASFTGCTAAGTSTATLGMQTPRTVCCRP